MAKDLISDGLAVSYFYNFVKRIFDNISLNSEVKSEKKAYPFTYDEVSLNIVIPKVLNDSEIKKCKDFVFKHNEVRLPIERGRDMSFFIENLESTEKKAIDFPTTIGAIIEFLKIDIDNLSGFIETDAESGEWKEREKLELDKFKEILEFLIDNYDSTKGKVDVRYLD